MVGSSYKSFVGYCENFKRSTKDGSYNIMMGRLKAVPIFKSFYYYYYYYYYYI